MSRNKNSKNSNAHDWRVLARSGFVTALDSAYSHEHFRRKQGSRTQKHNPSLPDFENFMAEDNQRYVTNSDATVIADSPKLKLPWMPRSSIVPKLLCILGAARAFGSKEKLHELCTPATLIEINIPHYDQTSEQLLIQVRNAIQHWTRIGREKSLDNETIAVKFPPDANDGNARTIAKNLASFTSEVHEKIREGKTVFVISTDVAQVNPSLAELRQHRLSAPPLDKAGLVEILRTLRTDAHKLSAKALRSMLPQDSVLRWLSPTVIEASLRQNDLASLIDRLTSPPGRSLRSQCITLDDVHGQNEAVAVFNRMIADLSRWRVGELAWSAAPMSAVMYGPPGNGKTLLAEAVAGSAGVPLVATSYADCQKHGHQGDMLRELHAAFERAFQLAPSVLFIDEIDNFSDRSSGHNADYNRGVVNGLLTLLSRATAFPGVILLAATNHLSTIDSAVIRPGRFDLKIPIQNPTKEGIEHILVGHLKQRPANDADREQLVSAIQAMVGMTGAEIAAKAREASAISRELKRPFEWSDLTVALRDRQLLPSRETILRIAVHEAGHLIVNALTSLPCIQRVNISSQHSSLELEPISLLTTETASELLRVLMAGRAAEKVYFGNVSTASGNGIDSDLARATLIALKIETEWCIDSPAPIWMKAETLLSLGMPSDVRIKVSKRLSEAEREAAEALSEHKEALGQLADVLVEKRELLNDDIQRTLRTLGVERIYADRANTVKMATKSTRQ